MVAALGNSKDYSLKQYLLFVEKLQSKSKVGEIPFYSIRVIMLFLWPDPYLYLVLVMTDKNCAIKIC